MAYKVIIAEKPSVAGSIAKIVGANKAQRSGPCGYLEGGGYRVTWAFGHLVGLQTPEQMGFQRGTFPIFPQQWKTKVLGKRDKDGKEHPDEMTQRQMKTIEKLFSEADEIIVATDAGREGELIFRYIYEHLGCRKGFRRLWISSLTDEAISKGLGQMKDGHAYDALSDAAHSRSQADWLVGYNASIALRMFTGLKGGVSLGRVQTPTLGMICRRYEENKSFVPTPFWQIGATLEKDGTPFGALSQDRYATEQQAMEAHEALKASGVMRVDKVEKKHSVQKPPLLYDLTALQRAANTAFGLTADATLRTAQSLYEKKYLSYPRTGSRYIPEDVYKTLPGLLQRLSGYGQLGRWAASLALGRLCRKSVNDAKVTDHHALLPTGNMPEDLDGNERKIYDMVFTRMLQALGSDYEADVTAVTLSSGGALFSARGSVPTAMGWKAYGKAEEEKKGEDEDEGALPPLTEGETLAVKASEVLAKSDKPLPIYTDSSLLAEMETCGKKIEDEELRESMKDVGLGTPATRAATIETLLTRGYVQREGKKLVPTSFGMQIWKIVEGRKIADVATTGEWEYRLGQVERGAARASEFDAGIRGFVEEVIEDLRNNCKPLDGVSDSGEPLRKCPVCGRTMKNMPYSVSCLEEEGGCGLKIPRTVAGKKLPATAIESLCSKGRSATIKGFTSKSGKKFDASLKIDTGGRKLVFDFTQAEKISTEGLACPRCGKALEQDGGQLRCGCGFTMWTTAFGARLDAGQIKTLLGGGKAAVFGMKSKSGKTFNARLGLGGDGRFEMEFINDRKK